jgi:hypothetical protein
MFLSLGATKVADLGTITRCLGKKQEEIVKTLNLRINNNHQ